MLRLPCPFADHYAISLYSLPISRASFRQPGRIYSFSYSLGGTTLIREDTCLILALAHPQFRDAYTYARFDAVFGLGTNTTKTVEELKSRAISAKNTTAEKMGNTRDKYTSVSTNKLDLEARQAKPPPPPVPSKSRGAIPPPVTVGSKPATRNSLGSPPTSPKPDAVHMRAQLRAHPAPVVKNSTRPGVVTKPVTRLLHMETMSDDEPTASHDRIDWVNLSPADKAVFFGWLDEFFDARLKTGKPPSGPSTVESSYSPRPTLATRKSTTDTAPVTKSHFGATVAALQAQERPAMPNHAQSTPPLPGNRPFVPLTSRPTEPVPAPVAFSEECLYCRDFSEVDAHAAQFPRQEVESVHQLAHDLTDPFPHVTDKARAIFTWLHHNITYNVQDFFAGTVKASNPEATLRSGLAVCEGYAGLFADLALRVGLECVVVGGHGKGYGYTQPEGPLPSFQGNHAWNAIRFDDGEWHLIDSCWGAGALMGTEYKQRFDPSHFCASNEDFGTRHFPEPAEPWKQYVEQPLTWEEYLGAPEKPRIMGTFWDYGFAGHLLQPDTLKIHPGRQSFFLKLGCEHVVETEKDVYVPIIISQKADKVAFIHDAVNGGWSITIDVVSGETVIAAAVTSMRNADAFGAGRTAFEAAKGRAAMQFAYLCQWEVL
jgi:hypothetical protein